ncbi:MAG: hypothetical protein JXA73_17460 [Acidobacteria bacterium]|nr:hypothetical protein [Acidobacteriota bacterium]
MIQAVIDGTLTLEHVPPKSLGGKPLVLTCKDCNSGSGHSIDSAAALREDVESILDVIMGRKEDANPRAAEMIVGGNRVQIRVSRSGGFTELKLVESASKPDALQGAQDVLETHVRNGTGQGEEIRIEVTRKAFHTKAAISDLKTAFLAAFAFFGYRFALHPNLRPVREQILQPDQDIIGNRFHTTLNDEASLKEPTLIAITEPLPCIAAIIGKRIILMPEPHGDRKLYEIVRREDYSKTFKGNALGWPVSMEFRLDRFLARNKSAQMTHNGETARKNATDGD